MTLTQFRILLPQALLGILTFWRLCVTKDFFYNHGAWFYHIPWMMSRLLICCGPALMYILLCICSDMLLPYSYVMIICNLIVLLIPNIVPEAWIYATTRFQRILWDAGMYIVLAMLIINVVCDHWLRSAAIDKEIAEISKDNDRIRREIAEKEVIISRFKRERTEQIASAKQNACRRLIKKKKRR